MRLPVWSSTNMCRITQENNAVLFMWNILKGHFWNYGRAFRPAAFEFSESTKPSPSTCNGEEELNNFTGHAPPRPAPAPLQRKNKSHSHSRLTRPGRDVTLRKFKQTARGLRQLPNAKNFADPHIPYHVPIRCSSISDGGASRQRKSVANAPPGAKEFDFK